MRRLLSSIALVVAAALSCAPEVAHAQALSSLPRATAPELGDSTLLLVQIASPFRTRATTVGLLKTLMGANFPLLAPNGALGAPSYSFSNFTSTGMYAAAGPTLILGVSGAQTLAMTSTQVQPQVQIMGGTFGTAAAPAFGFTSSGGQMGLYRYGADTLGIATGGVASLGIRGGAAVTIFGGAGSMTIQAGTGNNRSLTFNTTDGTGTAVSALALGSSGNVALLPNKLFRADSIGASGTGQRVTIGNVVTDTLAILSSLIRGGAGNMTIRAGTGNSRTLALQATTSAGAATTVATLSTTTTVSSITGGLGNLTLSPASGAATVVNLNAHNSASASFQLASFAGTDSSLTLNGHHLAANGVQTAPSYSFTNGSDVGMYLIDNGVNDTLAFTTGSAPSLKITGGASPKLVGGAGNMTIQAGTGASRTMTLQATDGASAATSVALLTASGLFAATDNTLQLGDATHRWSAVRGASLIADGGGLTITGNASITGGAGSMTVTAGTGASRTMTLQTTNSVSAAFNSMVLAADSSVTFAGRILAAPGTVAAPGIIFNDDGDTGFTRRNGDNANDSITVVVNAVVGPSFKQDTVRFPAKVVFAGLTAEPSTQSALCIDNTSKQVYSNAAATCTVSSLRFKNNIAPLDYGTARRIVDLAQPVTFDYKADGSHAIGVIAEQADSIDHRLATRDAEGRVTSVNYEQFTMALLVEVKALRRELDSLKAVQRRKP